MIAKRNCHRENKTFNGKNRHFLLTLDAVKQLGKDEIISIDYVKSKKNLTDPLTKRLDKKMIYQTSVPMGQTQLWKLNNDGNPTYVIGDLMKLVHMSNNKWLVNPKVL